MRRFAASLGDASLQEEKVLQAAVTSCAELLRARQSSIWLLDRRGERLVLRAATGYALITQAGSEPPDYPLQRPRNEPLGITAWIFLQQKPVVADTFAELQRHEGYRGQFDQELHLGKPEPCQQFYGIPISLGETHFGVLKVENKVAPNADGTLRFSEADQAVLDTVAAMLAVALKLERASREAEDRLRDYHRFTLHTIADELLPGEAARGLLHELVKRGSVIRGEELEKPYALLAGAMGSCRFFLNNLRRLQREQVDEMRPIVLWEIASNEMWLFGETVLDKPVMVLWPPESDNLLDSKARLLKTATVMADAALLVDAFKEGLRNARKAIYLRQKAEERENRAVTQGEVHINLKHSPPDERLPAPHLCLSISDNGIATTDVEHRRALEEGWRAVAVESPNEGEAPPLGLAAIDWIISKHGGYVTLESNNSRTKLSLHLPYCPSTGASEAVDG